MFVLWELGCLVLQVRQLRELTKKVRTAGLTCLFETEIFVFSRNFLLELVFAVHTIEMLTLTSPVDINVPIRSALVL